MRLYEAYDYQRKPPAPPPKTVNMVWTDEAFKYLVARATINQYVTPGTIKPRGLANYINSLTNPLIVYTDTRPQYLADLSLLLSDPRSDHRRRRHARSVTSIFDPSLPYVPPGQETGPHHPIWWDPDLDTRRRGHVFVLHTFPIHFFSHLALLFQIGDPYHRHFQTNPVVLAQNALEAIGRRALTPSFEVPNAHPYKQPLRKHASKEIAW